MHWRIAIVTVVATLLLPVIAHADGLTVTSAEYGSWPASVAALQSDLNSEGSTLHLTLRDEVGEIAACGSYALSLDPAGAQAFVLGACDPTTSATELRLVRRAALFAHDDVVPRPLVIAIQAVETRTGGAAGGAGSVGGSELLCSVAVRPYLNDMEHGTRVFLTPGRFSLRTLANGIAVGADAAGWMLRGAASASLSVDYEVVDNERGTVVLRDRATLACADGSVARDVTAPLVVDTSAPPAPPRARTSVVPYVLLGAGVALAGAGAALLLLAQGQHESALASGMTSSAAMNDAMTNQLLGEILLGASAAVVAGGIVSFVLARRSRPAAPTVADSRHGGNTRRVSLRFVGVGPTANGDGAMGTVGFAF